MRWNRNTNKNAKMLQKIQSTLDAHFGWQSAMRTAVPFRAKIESVKPRVPPEVPLPVEAAPEVALAPKRVKRPKIDLEIVRKLSFKKKT